jgi:hypothetical protein
VSRDGQRRSSSRLGHADHEPISRDGTAKIARQAIRIIGSKDILQAAIAGKKSENGNVRGFVREWRAIPLEG